MLSNRRYSPAAEREFKGLGSSCLGKIFVAGVVLLMCAALAGAALSSGQPDYSQGECKISDEFPGTIQQWCALITHYALESHLPPDLVAALILQESNGNWRAYSHSGAVGLMQVMPSDGRATTFECPGGPCFTDRPSSRQLRNPDFNLQYGTRLLRQLLDRNGGNWREALRAYGPMDAGYTYADLVLEIYHRLGK